MLLRPLRVAGPALHDLHEPSPVRIAVHVDHHAGAVTERGGAVEELLGRRRLGARGGLRRR
jgi:hypothetical protein